MELPNIPGLPADMLAAMGVSAAIGAGLIAIILRADRRAWRAIVSGDVGTALACVAAVLSATGSGASIHAMLEGAPQFQQYALTLAAVIISVSAMVCMSRGWWLLATPLYLVSITTAGVTIFSTLVWAEGARAWQAAQDAKAPAVEQSLSADKARAAASAEAIRASIATEEKALQAAYDRQAAAVAALSQLPTIVEAPQLEALTARVFDLQARITCEETAQPAGCIGETGPVRTGGRGPAWTRLSEQLESASARLDDAKAQLSSGQKAAAEQRQTIVQSIDAAEKTVVAARARLDALQAQLDQAQSRETTIAAQIETRNDYTARPWSVAVIDGVEYFTGRLGAPLKAALLITAGMMALSVDGMTFMYGLRRRLRVLARLNREYQREQRKFRRDRRLARLRALNGQINAGAAIGLIPELKRRAHIAMLGQASAEAPAQRETPAPSEAPVPPETPAPKSTLIKEAAQKAGAAAAELKRPPAERPPRPEGGGEGAPKEPTSPTPSPAPAEARENQAQPAYQPKEVTPGAFDFSTPDARESVRKLIDDAISSGKKNPLASAAIKWRNQNKQAFADAGASKPGSAAHEAAWELINQIAEERQHA